MQLDELYPVISGLHTEQMNSISQTYLMAHKQLYRIKYF